MLYRICLIVLCCLLISSVCKAQTDTEEVYGFKLIRPIVSPQLQYEDRFIRIKFLIGSSLTFQLENKTDNPIEVEWAKASYIDTSSEAHKIIHEGVRYIERDKALPSTMIPPNAKITDLLHPVDYIRYDKTPNSGWTTDDLFDNLASDAGKSFGVFLPIKVGSISKNYSFRFLITKTTRTVPAKPRLDIDSSEMKKEQIFADHFGASWPFIFEAGILSCKGKLVFITGNRETYLVSRTDFQVYIDGVALKTNINEVKNAAAKAGRVNFSAIENKGLSLCY